MRTTDQQSHDDIDNRNAQEQKKLEEENIAALRDAAEAISISRAALEATLAQGEQLQHCDDINARNKYIVDKSARIVRGMTWSGWMMNAFSKDSQPPTNSKAKSEQASTGSRDDDNVNGTDGITSILTESEVATLPQHLQNFACMLQNYECNVLLLEKYKDTLEYDTCVEVCKQLYISTKKEMEDGKANTLACASRKSGSIQLLRRLEKKLEEVHDLQYTIIIEERQHQQQLQKWTGREGTVLWKNKKVLRAKTITSDTGRALQHRIDKQDEHLDALAGNIQELLHNGVAIGTTLESQNQLLGKLESDTDDLTEHTKMVSRRADRLSHRSVSCFFIVRIEYCVMSYHDTSYHTIPSGILSSLHFFLLCCSRFIPLISVLIPSYGASPKLI